MARNDRRTGTRRFASPRFALVSPRRYNSANSNTSNSNTQTLLEMKFDRMGRRVEYVETVGSVTNKHQKFVYDGYLCIQRLNGSNNSITELFEWDPTEKVATRPLYWQLRTVDGNFSLFYTHDGNKNVSEVVHFSRANGVAAHYEYAPFGEVTAQVRQGCIAAYDFAALNPWRFSSEYVDDALGCDYYNYRHYEPMMGRWLSRDPVCGVACNLYCWLSNRILDVDVLGLLAKGDKIEVRDGYFDVGDGNIGTISIESFSFSKFGNQGDKRHKFVFLMLFTPGESFCKKCDKERLRWIQWILSDSDIDPEMPQNQTYPKLDNQGSDDIYYPMFDNEMSAVRWTASGAFRFSDTPSVYKRITPGETVVSFKTCLVCAKKAGNACKENDGKEESQPYDALSCVNWTIVYGVKVASGGRLEEYFHAY